MYGSLERLIRAQALLGAGEKCVPWIAGQTILGSHKGPELAAIRGAPTA